VAERSVAYVPNPHKNHITESNDVECTVCHHGHKADNPACLACHMGLTFEKK
jgi:dihydrodipicolinate reductase